MSTFYRWPSPNRGEFARQFGGIVEALRHYSAGLPLAGWDEVDDENAADLVTGHLGTKSQRLDVFHCHGLYPTGEPQFGDNNYQGNIGVIENIRRAGAVVCVSEWVADILRRDMHLRPYTLGHGFDLDAWQQVPRGTVSDRPYALWNKTRAVGVCDPSPVIDLAHAFPDFGFVTTFLPRSYPRGTEPENVQVTGLLKHEDAWRVVKDARIYLATTKETFGISTLEAMASGAVVVGYRWGATPEIVGDTGLLVDPGDTQGLIDAFKEAQDRHAELSEAAMARVATLYTWDNVIARLAAIYTMELEKKRRDRPLVTVIIPCHNYAAYVQRAIYSVRCQTMKDWELVIVDDASTDMSVQNIEALIAQEPKARLVRNLENEGVAMARNRGIAAGTGKYVVCLDADDAMHPSYLETVIPALEADPTLGIAYTGLHTIDDQDRLLERSGWPKQYDPGMWPGHNQVPTCCAYRRDLWERAGGYRSRYCPHGAGQEDADLWFRMLTLGGGARLVTDEPLFFYRNHKGQTTRAHREYWQTRQYVAWYPSIFDGLFPLASQAGKPPQGSYPVRNYDQPKVSVIVPVGPNHRDTLIDAIDSVEAQTERHWELVIVNDSGQPLNLAPWPFIKCVDTGGTKGAGKARNLGTEAATAPLIVYLDADDVLQPTFLADCLQAYKIHKRWVYSDLYLLHEDGRAELYEVEDWGVEKLWRSGLAAVTCLYTREMWAAVGGFDEDLVGREDWDFHLRLAKAGFCGVHLPLPLFTYRHGTGRRRKEGQLQREIAILHDRYPKGDLEMACKSCGGARRAQAPRAMESKITKGDFVPMEYTADTAERSYRGRSGRIYRVDGGRSKRFMAHPSDVQQLLRLRVFRVIDPDAQDGEKATLTVEPQPRAGSMITMPTPTGQATEALIAEQERRQAAQEQRPQERQWLPPMVPLEKEENRPGNGVPDPNTLTVAEIKALELDQEQWVTLLMRERQGKGRVTAMVYMEGQIDGEIDFSNTAPA